MKKMIFMAVVVAVVELCCFCEFVGGGIVVSVAEAGEQTAIASSAVSVVDNSTVNPTGGNANATGGNANATGGNANATGGNATGGKSKSNATGGKSSSSATGGSGIVNGAIDIGDIKQSISFPAKQSRMPAALPGIQMPYGPASVFLNTTGSVNPSSVLFVLFYNSWFAVKPELMQYRVGGSSPYIVSDVPGVSQKTKLYFVGSPSYFNPADGVAAQFIDYKVDPTQAVIPLGYLVVSSTSGNEDGVGLPVIDHDALRFAGTLRGYPRLVLIKSAQAMGAGLGQISSGSSLGAGFGGTQSSFAGFFGASFGGSRGDSATFMVSRLAVIYLVVAYDVNGVNLPLDAFETWVEQQQQKQAAVAQDVASPAAEAEVRSDSSRRK